MKPPKLLCLFVLTALAPTLFTTPMMNSITSEIDVNSDMTWASLQLHPNADNGETNIKFKPGSKIAEISNTAGQITITYNKSTLLNLNSNSAATKLDVNYDKGINLTGNLVINNKNF